MFEKNGPIKNWNPTQILYGQDKDVFGVTLMPQII